MQQASVMSAMRSRPARSASSARSSIYDQPAASDRSSDGRHQTRKPPNGVLPKAGITKRTRTVQPPSPVPEIRQVTGSKSALRASSSQDSGWGSSGTIGLGPNPAERRGVSTEPAGFLAREGEPGVRHPQPSPASRATRQQTVGYRDMSRARPNPDPERPHEAARSMASSRKGWTREHGGGSGGALLDPSDPRDAPTARGSRPAEFGRTSPGGPAHADRPRRPGTCRPGAER